MTRETDREWSALWRRILADLATGAPSRNATKPSSKQWADYIHAEVRAACTQLGWRYQVRRKWSRRERPLVRSEVEDYEWKLIPNGTDQLPDLPRTDEGTYYVFSLDRHRGRFVLEHSTIHVGVWGPDHQLRTFTEIDGIRVPIDGYVRWFLLNLTARFKPNSFSST